MRVRAGAGAGARARDGDTIREKQPSSAANELDWFAEYKQVGLPKPPMLYLDTYLRHTDHGVTQRCSYEVLNKTHHTSPNKKK